MKLNQFLSKINLVSTYDEVNLGDDLLLYAGMLHYQSIPHSTITVNGRKINTVFRKRKSNKSATHLKRLSLFSRNIYYGGTNFIFPSSQAKYSSFIRCIYYILLAIVFRIRLVANGIADFPKTFSLFYKICSRISVRDHESLLLLEYANIKAILEEDPVISLFKANDQIFKDKTKLTNVKGVLILRCEHLLDPQYKKEIDLLLANSGKQKFTHVVFFREGEHLDHYSYSTDLKCVTYDGSIESMSEIFKIIRSSTFVYSMRLHGLILARLFGVKCSPIVIDNKLQRTYKGLGDVVSL